MNGTAGALRDVLIATGKEKSSQWAQCLAIHKDLHLSRKGDLDLS
jgi:hypothetical protein